jgi:hypothetical protein
MRSENLCSEKMLLNEAWKWEVIIIIVIIIIIN